MVIAAVEAAYDAGRGEVDVARFLGLLGDSTRRWEQQQADTLLSQAMEAVTEPGASTETSTSTSRSSTSGSSSSASTSTTGHSTIRPRGVTRPQHRAAEQDSSLFRIDV